MLKRFLTAAITLGPVAALTVTSGCAQISIRTHPEGAKVYVKRIDPRKPAMPKEQMFWGETPLIRSVPWGEYKVSLVKQGCVKLEFPIRADFLKGTKIRKELIKCGDMPEGMVYVPPGKFTMGEGTSRNLFTTGSNPEREVTLAGFFIDRYEVTNAQYREFLEWIRATGDHSKCHEKELEDKDHTPKYWDDPAWNRDGWPVVGVDWYDAYAFAAWAGKRLPTEAEWEKAARGTDGRIYPWGNKFAEERCNIGSKGTEVVGKYENGMSPFGCYDMAGNVLEWCMDWYAEDSYTDDNPSGPAKGIARVLRGGSWGLTGAVSRSTLREARLPDTRSSFIGFRCAKDANISSGKNAVHVTGPASESER